MKRALSLARSAAAVALCLAPVFARAQSSHVAEDRSLLFASDELNAGGAALSPDGGRLALQILASPSEAALWTVRSADEPATRLTSDGYWDANPEWAPDGARLYFTSNRTAASGEPHSYGMAVDVDERTGGAAGEPMRVTTDAVAGAMRVSPDGATLAYIDGQDRRLLKAVPAAGGDARLIARLPLRSGNLAWSTDGRHIYFVTAGAEPADRVLHRVPAAGGAIEAVEVDLGQGRIIWGRGAETFALELNLDHPLERSITLRNREGEVFGSITTDRSTRVADVLADGGVVAVVANVTAPTRVMSVSGGSFREITTGEGYDWVMRWSADGGAIYTWTLRNGDPVLARVPFREGDATYYPDAGDWGIHGATGRYFFKVSPADGVQPRTLVAVDRGDGSRHTVSEALPARFFFPVEPGGTWATLDELFFVERHGDRADVRVWTGPGEVRTLRTLPAAVAARSTIAVHGDHVAWQEERDDALEILLADGPDAQPRRLLTTALMPSRNELAFSHDGRRLAFHHSRGPGSPDLMAIVDVDGASEPLIIETGLTYWYWPRWLPDDSGVLVIGGGAGAEAHVVLVPAREGAEVVNITAGHDPASKWGFEVSPDGRYIAYPGEIWSGSSVWRFDFAGHAHRH